MSIIRRGRAAAKAAVSGKFFTVKVGDSATIAPMQGLDDIISIDQHTLWRAAGNSPSFPCIGKGCPGCAKNDQPRFRGFLNVLTIEGEVKVWAFPISVYRLLEEIEESIGSIQGKALKVRAKKKGQFTDYSVTAMGKTVKLEGHELIEIEPLLGPQTRDGILELLASGDDAEEEAEEDDDEDEKPVKKTPKPAAKVEEAPAKKAPKPAAKAEEESTSPVEDEDDDWG